MEYVFGLARNRRLEPMIASELTEAKTTFLATSKPARIFEEELAYRTRDSWSRSRRVVGKAEHLEKGSNPRFIVTSLPAEQIGGQELYETIYCHRNKMGKPHQRDISSDLYADSYQSRNPVGQPTPALARLARLRE